MADHDGYTIKRLTPDTWDAFADLDRARHNGVWNGCWCTWLINAYAEKDHTAEGNRALKKRRVEEGTNHAAALVFAGDRAVAWCEYGTPEELPNIYHRKEYEEGAHPPARLPSHLLLRRQGLPPQGRRRRRPCAAPSTSSPRPAAAWSRATPRHRR